MQGPSKSKCNTTADPEFDDGHSWCGQGCGFDLCVQPGTDRAALVKYLGQYNPAGTGAPLGPNAAAEWLSQFTVNKFAPAAATATRVIRFLDENGAERYGHVAEDVDINARMLDSSLRADLIEGDLFGDRALSGQTAAVTKLLAPVPMPPQIYGIGLNYREHAIQANLTIPVHPAVFFKNRHSHNDPLSPVVIPALSSLPDYEGELAVVLSTDCKDATLENALDCVLGYTAANDVSARCWQVRRCPVNPSAHPPFAVRVHHPTLSCCVLMFRWP